MKGNKKGISIIELMISMSLVVILGTVGALSFVGYMSSLRDSARVIELHNIDAVFRGFNLRSGFYPDPTDFYEITYSGALVWKQGIYGDSVSDNIGYSRNVMDPLTGSKYTYSITSNKSEFSLAGVLESSPDIVYKNLFLKEAMAEGISDKKGVAFVVGDFNSEIVPITIGGVNNILALPSIVSSDLSSTDLSDILNNNKLVYNNYDNLPASYDGSKFDLGANLDFSSNNLVIFSGSISDLNQVNNRISLVQDVCDSYSGTLVGSNISISTVDKVDLFSVTPSKTIEMVACDFVNFKLKYLIECE